jgi:anaerobic magnesium-protoporphyrin IX monomethyl ester cyclase
MKILFATHDLSYADHISFAYLSAIAKQLGHQTYFCTFQKENFSPNDLMTMVAEVKPEVVAYSANILGFQRAVEVNRQAKQIHNFYAILGGPQATFSQDTFGESGMDAYCVGEGELAFQDFLERVEEGLPFDDVANLITAKGSNPIRPLIKNLDDLPMPDRDLVLSNSGLKSTSKKTFYATRGCPFDCAYCANNYYHRLYKGKGAYVRRFSVNRLLLEIEHVMKTYQTEFVKFGDDCFVFQADEWLEEFAEQYPKRIGIPFNCFLRIDLVDERLIGLLKKAGCFSVHLSVDSTSSNIRNNILGRKMKDDNAVIIENLKLLHKHGIHTWVNYMLAAPLSTLQDDLAAITMSREGKVTYASFSTTVPMEGTDLYQYCFKNGLIEPSYVGDMSGCSRQSDLLCFSEKEKDVRFNIFLMGPLTSWLPDPLAKLSSYLIQHIPPNNLFRWLHQLFYDYSISHTIFKLAKS